MGVRLLWPSHRLAQPLTSGGGDRARERGLRPSSQLMAKRSLECRFSHAPAFGVPPVPRWWLPSQHGLWSSERGPHLGADPARIRGDDEPASGCLLEICQHVKAVNIKKKQGFVF